jgi:transcription elongation factor GreB
MTREGYEVITKEMNFLWREERPRIVQEVSDAADLGDRSENAAYIYGKRRLREIDSRLRYLKQRIEGVTPVDLAQIPPSPIVRFGAIVVVEDEDGGKHQYRLVDKDESAPARGRISVQSPIGAALLGRAVGDVARVRTPKGESELEIVEIRYGGGAP